MVWGYHNAKSCIKRSQALGRSGTTAWEPREEFEKTKCSVFTIWRLAGYEQIARLFRHVHDLNRASPKNLGHAGIRFKPRDEKQVDREEADNGLMSKNRQLLQRTQGKFPAPTHGNL